MGRVSRRDFLKAVGVASGAAIIHGRQSRAFAQASPPSPDKYVTCFYQFNTDSLKSLGGPAGLPNGDRYLHIFSMSHAGHTPNPRITKAVQSLGPSFKYARAIDIHKYNDWQHASADQLRQWAVEFRKECRPDDAPADYFAFNEMPTGAESDPLLQKQIATWLRYLHDPGDGAPKLPGVFYFVEENLVPSSWKGGEIDDLFAAIDETCDLVVGEHYHDRAYVYGQAPEEYATHLFALAKWMDASGKAPQLNIAAHKYAVLHSSWYGPEKTPWEGLQSGTLTPADFREYLRRVIQSTRLSPYGQRRIAFGPVVNKKMDSAEVIAALTEVLHEDATRPPKV